MSSNQEPTVTETIHVRRHQQNVPVCILNNPNRQSTPFLTNGEFFFCCNSLCNSVQQQWKCLKICLFYSNLLQSLITKTFECLSKNKNITERYSKQ